MARRGLPRNTSNVTSPVPQGWYEDPFRLHEARYFSAGQPTKLVRDGYVESYDEPPGEGVPGSGAPATWGNAAVATLKRAETSEAIGPHPLDDDVPAYARRRPRVGVLTTVAAAAVAGAAIAALIIGKSGSATGAAIEAVAYTTTMNANSADVDTVYAVTTGNQTFDTTATESGPVSWSADQGVMAMTTTSRGGQQDLTGQYIFDGRTTYSEISVKGVPADIPGITGWTQTTWTGASSPDQSILFRLLFGDLTSPAESSNPASLLGLLNAQASSIQNLGGEVLDGISTTHYRALIPLSRLGVSTAEEQQELQQVLGANSIGVDYWIDSTHLLRQLRFAMTIMQTPSTTSSTGEGTVPGLYPATISISLQLSHYGTPVHVVLPPPAQVKTQQTCVTSGYAGFSCSEGASR